MLHWMIGAVVAFAVALTIEPITVIVATGLLLVGHVIVTYTTTDLSGKRFLGGVIVGSVASVCYAQQHIVIPALLGFMQNIL